MEFDAVWIYVWPGIYFSRLFELVVEEDSDGTVSEEIVSKGDLRYKLTLLDMGGGTKKYPMSIRVKV